jgi:hypothetical protein
MVAYNPLTSPPVGTRDQWGQFRSKADIKAEQEAARFESLQIAREELYWQEQDRLDWEREEADQ